MTIAEKRVKAAEEKKKQHRDKQIRALALIECGYPVSDIAKVLGVSEATVKKLLKEKETKND